MRHDTTRRDAFVGVAIDDDDDHDNDSGNATETYLISDSARSSKYTATSSSVVRPSRFFSDSQRLLLATPICTLRKCLAVVTSETVVAVATPPDGGDCR